MSYYYPTDGNSLMNLYIEHNMFTSHTYEYLAHCLELIKLGLMDTESESPDI